MINLVIETILDLVLICGAYIIIYAYFIDNFTKCICSYFHVVKYLTDFLMTVK